MSQTKKILDYLLDGNTLTSLQALEKFGTMRLASRITDIKSMGHAIWTETIKLPNGKSVAAYCYDRDLIDEKIEDAGGYDVGD